MTSKPLKTERHHWWPRTLSDHWTSSDGMVSVIRPNGDVDRAPPGAYGGITNAHHMKFGGTWDSTFEPVFNRADNEIGDFARWLATVEAPTVGAKRPMIERIAAQDFPDQRLHQTARITASLLARSPSVRHAIKITTEHYRSRFGMADPTADKNLIAANQRGLYDAYRTVMERRGRWALLFTDNTEFVAGDGFLHNFPASSEGINSGKKLILPILPTACIVYMLPTQHPTEPRLVTLRVSDQEAEILNDIVQVYAREFLFFRDQKPNLGNSFKLCQHQMFEYHRHGWLDALLDDLSQYNLWGRDRVARICSIRPYSGTP